MSRWSALWRIDSATFTALFVWLMTIGPSSLFRDPGTLWHIRVGERMLDAGRTIRTDPYSATFAGEPWVPVGWLAECLVAVVHRIGGLDAILLGTAATLSWFYARMARRLSARGMQAPITALMLVLCLAASSYHFHPRPHLASMVLLGWMFTRLCDFEAGRLPMARLLWFLPVVILWTNLHGGVVGGLATFGLCGLGWTLAARTGVWRSPISSWIDFVRLALLGLGCLAVILVNPYGTELPWLWFSLLDSQVLPKLMIEHAPLSLAESSGQVLVVLMLVYTAALIGVPIRRIRVTWLIPAIWFVMTWSRIRNGPLFAIVATLAMAEMYPHIRWVRWLTDQGSELLALRPREERRALSQRQPLAAVLPALLVVGTLALQLGKVPTPVFGHGWARLDPGYWPVELLPELRAYEAGHPDGAAVFNDMLFGGFLIYFTPGLHAFIDDRCEVHGDQRLSEYHRALGGETSYFDAWARQYGLELALSVPDSPFDRYLRDSPAWVLEKQTDAASLYRKQAGT